MLSQVHVRALHDNPSTAVRADIAAAVAADLANGGLSADETRIAEDILSILAQDVERRVREALAEHVKDCPFLPHGIALALARDIEDSVALPILEHSPLLSDADLIAFVQTASAERQIAIAKRKSVTSPVADEIVEGGEPAAVGALLANDGADLSATSLLKTVVRFRANDTIGELLVDRPALPLVVCETLIASISKELCDRLVAQHGIPKVLADDLARHGREKAITEMLHCDEEAAADRLAAHLHARRRLTPMLVLRSLFLGDLCFFDSAIATLAGMPVAAAKRLVFGDTAGVRAIYQRAGLPPNLFPAFRVGLSAVRKDVMKNGRPAYNRYIVDQLTRVYDEVAPAGMEHVLAQLARQSASRLKAAEGRSAADPPPA
jgi:uncharacterized protein (DUF2336 family)